jgi:hypothetical protein
VLGIFETGSLELLAQAGFELSPDLCLWVARITDVSHWCLAPKCLFC